MKDENATLLDDSDSEENLDHFTVNEHFAKAYEVKKEREELSKRGCVFFLYSDKSFSTFGK